MFPEDIDSEDRDSLRLREKSAKELLREKLSSQPLTDTQSHRLPSDIKKQLRDGRWCRLKPEHYELFRYDEAALYFRRAGNGYQKLTTSARSQQSITHAFIRYRPVEKPTAGSSVNGGATGGAGASNSPEEPTQEHSSPGGSFGPTTKPKSTPPFINREPWLSIRSPKKEEKVHISADFSTRSTLLTRKFTPVTLKTGQTAMVIAQQCYGRADANLIYQFNDAFSKENPPAPGHSVDVHDGWELNVEISSRHIAHLDISWSGPTRGSKKVPVAMSDDPLSDPVLSSTKFPIKAGDYKITASGGGLTETRLLSITEELKPTDWLKIQAYYDDPWQTAIPLEQVNVVVNGATAKEKVKLNSGVGTSTVARNILEAERSMSEPGVLFISELTPGEVELVLNPDSGLERNIADAKEMLVMTLDGTYRNVVEQMQSFQEQWDTFGYASIAISGADGLWQGSTTWLKDQATLFEAETWSNLGGNIKDFAGIAYDYTATHASEVFETAKDSANKFSTFVEEGELSNWTWWQQQADDAIESGKSLVVNKAAELEDAYHSAIETIDASEEKIKKLFKYRKSILNLSTLIASGDAVAIENFIDNELMDIDRELATSIKENPDFYLVLALIAENDAALTFVAYSSLFVEAVPPNFYSFISGKGGAYVAIEVFLLLLLSFLTLGAGTAARLTALAARLSASSAKVATAGQKLKKAQQAVKAFTTALEDFADAATQLKALGKKLSIARSKGTLAKGKSGQTLVAKKEATKRDKQCRLCGKNDHSTPRVLKGVVVYE